MNKGIIVVLVLLLLVGAVIAGIVITSKSKYTKGSVGAPLASTNSCAVNYACSKPVSEGGCEGTPQCANTSTTPYPLPGSLHLPDGPPIKDCICSGYGKCEVSASGGANCKCNAGSNLDPKYDCSRCIDGYTWNGTKCLGPGCNEGTEQEDGSCKCKAGYVDGKCGKCCEATTPPASLLTPTIVKDLQKLSKLDNYGSPLEGSALATCSWGNNVILSNFNDDCGDSHCRAGDPGGENCHGYLGGEIPVTWSDGSKGTCRGAQDSFWWGPCITLKATSPYYDDKGNKGTASWAGSVFKPYSAGGAASTNMLENGNTTFAQPAATKIENNSSTGLNDPIYIIGPQTCQKNCSEPKP